MAFPTLEFLGVPLVEVLNPYRAMLAVLYPRADQIAGVVRATSLVYIGVRLTFAALIVAFGTWKLRKWNPGRSEPREQGEEAEVEVVETLVEVRRSQEEAEVPVAVGAVATATATALAPAARGGQPMPRSAHGLTARCTATGGGGAPFDDDRARPPGCTSPGGLTAGGHAGRPAVSHALGQPDPLARAR